MRGRPRIPVPSRSKCTVTLSLRAEEIEYLDAMADQGGISRTEAVRRLLQGSKPPAGHSKLLPSDPAPPKGTGDAETPGSPSWLRKRSGSETGRAEIKAWNEQQQRDDW